MCFVSLMGPSRSQNKELTLIVIKIFFSINSGLIWGICRGGPTKYVECFNRGCSSECCAVLFFRTKFQSHTWNVPTCSRRNKMVKRTFSIGRSTRYFLWWTRSKERERSEGSDRVTDPVRCLRLYYIDVNLWLAICATNVTASIHERIFCLRREMSGFSFFTLFCFFYLLILLLIGRWINSTSYISF